MTEKTAVPDSLVNKSVDHVDGFVILFDFGLKFIIGSHSKQEQRVLCLLAQRTKPGKLNFVKMDQRIIAEKLGCSKPLVSKNLNSIMERGAVKRINRGYFINPWIIFRGSPEELIQAKEKWKRLK